MLEFIIMLAIVVICGLLFGKADTKKELLNQVGLDLSPSNYEDKKRAEFAKYCKQAIKIASDGYKARNENDFLEYVRNFLEQKDFDNLYIGVKSHYVRFAISIIYRREEAIRKGNVQAIPNNIDFSNKTLVNRYIKTLWDKYQYPWPQNWLQKDGI